MQQASKTAAATPISKEKEKPSKAVTLRKLAGKRVPRAIKAIEMCGNLSNYEPTEAQRGAIKKAIATAIEKCFLRLDATQRTPEAPSFALPGDDLKHTA